MSYFEIINSERRRQEAIAELMRVPVVQGMPVYEVTIRKYKKLRTVRQNRLYWMWLEIIGDEKGYHREDLAFIIRKNFIGFDLMTDLDGQQYPVPRSTTTLNTKEFTEFLDKIYAFAISEGISLPIPRDYGFISGEVSPSKSAEIEEQKTLSIGYDKQTGEISE